VLATKKGRTDKKGAGQIGKKQFSSVKRVWVTESGPGTEKVMKIKESQKEHKQKNPKTVWE